jgi:hypothetical protein
LRCCCVIAINKVQTHCIAKDCRHYLVKCERIALLTCRMYVLFLFVDDGAVSIGSCTTRLEERHGVRRRASATSLADVKKRSRKKCGRGDDAADKSRHLGLERPAGRGGRRRRQVVKGRDLLRRSSSDALLSFVNPSQAPQR